MNAGRRHSAAIAPRRDARTGRGIDRRRFLRLGALAAGGAALGGWSRGGVRARPPIDILLRGGRVGDGTGRAAFAADVAVREGRIEAVGPLPDARAADTATFEAPHAFPVGIPHVIVGGRLAVRDGAPTGELPGRVLTPI